MKNVAFWDMALCGSCENLPFGGMFASIFGVEKSASKEKHYQLASRLNHSDFFNCCSDF
jgi:hypothetical protein